MSAGSPSRVRNCHALPPPGFFLPAVGSPPCGKPAHASSLKSNEAAHPGGPHSTSASQVENPMRRRAPSGLLARVDCCDYAQGARPNASPVMSRSAPPPDSDDLLPSRGSTPGRAKPSKRELHHARSHLVRNWRKSDWVSGSCRWLLFLAHAPLPCKPSGGLK